MRAILPRFAQDHKRETQAHVVFCTGAFVVWGTQADHREMQTQDAQFVQTYCACTNVLCLHKRIVLAQTAKVRLHTSMRVACTYLVILCGKLAFAPKCKRTQILARLLTVPTLHCIIAAGHLMTLLLKRVAV
jgi:hypothetical protein